MILDFNNVLTMSAFVVVVFLQSKEGRVGLQKVIDVFSNINKEVNSMLGLAISSSYGNTPLSDLPPKPDFLDKRFAEVTQALESNFSKMITRLETIEKRLKQLEDDYE